LQVGQAQAIDQAIDQVWGLSLSDDTFDDGIRHSI
jgi:hypothetical protein